MLVRWTIGFCGRFCFFVKIPDNGVESRKNEKEQKV
ncbi:MAG: hypothetical protein BWY53_00302 [Parcubacteria group bacterium ADurb.Bin326]|nr:MAG: hypothetical protein BWY53_00302 [Parcubacteria group bacterium ADurb.Bin326]